MSKKTNYAKYKLLINKQEHSKNKKMNFQIEPMQIKDWPQVLRIFAESISTGIATFETKLPNWEEWDSGRLQFCRFVAREGKNVLGWATLSPSHST